MLSPGTWLNHYQILGHLGTGGMGEVYRARDNKLDREVALKVLPEHFARDPERVARFRREAQLLAQLNHPNIATIYNFEEAGETRFLVMELVLGDTLRERIHPSRAREQAANAGIPVPIEEALKIAKQIAEALEHAHEKPIIHRDLKPANIKVTPAGQVKVLDFGLAKAFATAGKPVDPADIPTGSQHDTLKGTILGTPAYMSPEQASGRETDKRTDIWAFGCVLYELLTGKWVFQSPDRKGGGQDTPPDTITEIIASVLKSEPDWTALPTTTPQGIRVLLRRCLEKDTKRRFRDAADIVIEIEEVQSAAAEPARAKHAAPRVRRWAIISGLACLVVAALTALVVWNLRPATSPTQTSTAHFVISLPPGQQLADLGFGTVMALSPDGTRLAYVARSGNAPPQIYIRTIDSPEARPLPGTEGGANPFFSPDGQWLGFSRPGKLEKISVSGGSPVTVFNSGGPLIGSGATWGADDTIVFQPSNIGDLWRVPAAGGEAQRLQNTLNLQKGLVASRWPEFLPGGNEVLFAAADNAANWYSPQLGIYRLETGERRDLPQGGTRPRYAPTGHLLYVQNGTLMAAPFDPRRLEVTGAQVPVGENVMQLRGGAAQYSLSDNGVLAYVQGFASVPGTGTPNFQTVQQTFVWVDRKGMEQPIPAPAHAYRSPRLSPDGRRIAVAVDEPGSQIWIYDLTRETLTRLTFEGGRSNSPVWTPDGKRVTFGSGSPTNLFWQSADGSGKAERLATSQNPQSALSWSPDGQSLVLRVQTSTMCNDLWVLQLSDRKAEPFLQTPFCESSARFSPDGRWLAYLSDESGRDEVYVQPYPGPGGKWQISTEGGQEPIWNPSGRELFYRNGNKMMAVDITAQPGFSAGKPRTLFEGPYVLSPTTTANYDVPPDGQRFLMLKGGGEQQAATQIHVVLNWFEELKRRVPAR